MQELEKILEEIEMKKKKCLDIVRVEIDPMEITIHREQYKGLRMAEDIIRKHMNDGWIPVEERLPEEAGTYIINALTGERNIVTFAKWQNRYKRFDMTGARTYWRIIAWRPLPEPYQAERSDSHDGK